MSRITAVCLVLAASALGSCTSTAAREERAASPAMVRVYDAAIVGGKLWLTLATTREGISRFVVGTSPIPTDDLDLNTGGYRVLYESAAMPVRAQILTGHEGVYVSQSGSLQTGEQKATPTQAPVDRLIRFSNEGGSPTEWTLPDIALSRCVDGTTLFSLHVDGSIHRTEIRPTLAVREISSLGQLQYPHSLVCGEGGLYAIDGVAGQFRKIDLKDGVPGPAVPMESGAVTKSRSKLAALYSKQGKDPVFTGKNSHAATVSMCTLITARHIGCLVNGFNVLESAWISEFPINEPRMTPMSYYLPLHSLIVLKDGKANSGIRKLILTEKTAGVVTMDGKVRMHQKDKLAQF